MNKLTVAIVTLLLIVMAGALLAAACGGGDDEPELGEPGLLEPSQEDPRPLYETCDVHEESCRALIQDSMRPLSSPPPPLDPRTKQIFLQDPTIQAMVGSGVEGEDYWLQLTPASDPGHGNDPGMVAGAGIVFAAPVSWQGVVNTVSQPCKGLGDEGFVDPDHPCRIVELEFGTTTRSYTEIRVVSANVFVLQELVVNIFGSSPYPETIDDLIEQYSSYPQ